MRQNIDWETRRYNRDTGELAVGDERYKVGVEGDLAKHYAVIDRLSLFDGECGIKNFGYPAVFRMLGWYPSENKTTFSWVDNEDERARVLEKFSKREKKTTRKPREI